MNYDIAAAKLETLRAQAELARVEVQRAAAPTTVEQWCEEWFRTIALRKIRPKTAATYATMLSRYIIPILGSRPLESLTPRDVRLMNETLLSRGLSSSTARHAYRVLAVALKYAVREDLISRNVATMVDPPPTTSTRLTVITPEQARQVIRTAFAQQDPLASMWAAVFLTGARQSELLGLELLRVSDHLDLSWQLQRLTWQHGCQSRCLSGRAANCPERRVEAPAHLPKRHLYGGYWLTAPKTKAGGRIVPLVDPMKTIIAGHLSRTRDEPNPHGLVWRTPTGAPLEHRAHNRKWHEALARAGVPDARLHDGRHTTVDLLYAAGVPEVVISEICGHVALDTTRGYRSRRPTAALTDAMERVAQELALDHGSLPPQKPHNHPTIE